MNSSIRGQYEQHGSDRFYRQHGHSYRNPHEPVIARSLKIAKANWPLDLSNVLDLAAGSGEVTLAVREVGAGAVHGIDPYTWAAYQSRTGQAAERLTFSDIAAGALAGRRYSLIVASFALHLCEPSRLPSVLWALSQVSDALLVLTPHKRPQIRREFGWEFREERIIERVRSRLYRTVSND